MHLLAREMAAFLTRVFGSQLTRSRQIQADPESRFFRSEAEGLEITSLLQADIGDHFHRLDRFYNV